MFLVGQSMVKIIQMLDTIQDLVHFLMSARYRDVPINGNSTNTPDDVCLKCYSLFLPCKENKE